MSSDLRLAKSFYFTAIEGVASFPEVMVAIRTAIADPNASPGTVGRAVERDVAFASRLLRIVNAPTVGLIRPCGSVPHAVNLVGMERIGMHAEKVASLSALSQCAAIAPEVTARAAVEAAIARTIAAEVGASPEHAFTAALLADMGVVAFLATQPHWSQTRISTDEERARLGFDHAELGADILRRWNLPMPIPDVVALHHDLDGAKKRGGDVERLVAILQAAEYLAPGVECTGDKAQAREWELLAKHPALELLGIGPAKLATMWPALVAGIAEDARPSTPASRDENYDRATLSARPARKQTKAFYFALFAAVAIPAAVGFELFFRR